MTAGAQSGRLVLDIQRNASDDGPPATPEDRLARAAAWALDMDAHYRQLIRSGRSPQIRISAASSTTAARVHLESVAEYRGLRLGMGELIRPVLMDPPNLDGLYAFQREGVRWLCDTHGAILADDMGLGKTVQAIAAMRTLFNRCAIRSSLVVCPKSLIATWERELNRWAPELGSAVVTPPGSIREDAWRAVAQRRHVLLTNYEQLREPPEVLQSNTPDLIVADEAHRLRNRAARITSGSFRLRPPRFWALSGTPVERDLEDLATLLSLVAPTRFAPTDAKLHPASLRSQARPYVLRRRRKDVLEQLPAVLDSTDMLDLSDGQERAYRSAIAEFWRTHRPGDELALITRLQSICDSDDGESSKIDRTMHLLDGVREQGEKAVVFSHRLEPLRELQRRVTERWGWKSVALLIGEMSADERTRTVNRFRDEPETLVLLASLKVGGEGLTLVEANHVVLFNQWWNPSANDQARDRVVRIGQRRKVRVYRYCCRNTIEEALEHVLATKRDLFADAVERMADDWSELVREVGLERLLSRPGEARNRAR